MLLAEICLLTNDVPRLATFYKNILRTTSDCDDEIHQAIKTEGALLTIYNNGEVKKIKNENIVIAFTVDNVDLEFERLKQTNITILEPPTTRPWGARNMIFQDPDGNTVAFRSILKNKNNL